MPYRIICAAFLINSKKDNAIKSYCNFNNGYKRKVYTLGQLYTEYLSIIESRVNIDLTPSVFNRYKLAMNKFMEINNLDDSTPADEINSYHLVNLENHMKKDHKQSTIAGYMIKIKTIFKSAFAAGKIKAYPFSEVKVKRGVNSDIEFLTEEGKSI